MKKYKSILFALFTIISCNQKENHSEENLKGAKTIKNRDVENTVLWNQLF